ncbi:hypothetical protein I5E68_05220 [Novosphingobium sp. YJ-S2-02]|uniref:Uncharacterized protein n=1 Tax=Novosphingobium aureum TaxID=2792964 RepID=A0A931HAT9_9SPHN|nr:hypothetical protein [Novosphingobium aureum]MBH0112354.1 hypothetical protein [Novosphingobium aureum]
MRYIFFLLLLATTLMLLALGYRSLLGEPFGLLDMVRIVAPIAIVGLLRRPLAKLSRSPDWLKRIGWGFGVVLGIGGGGFTIWRIGSGLVAGVIDYDLDGGSVAWAVNPTGFVVTVLIYGLNGLFLIAMGLFALWLIFNPRLGAVPR